MLRILAVCFVFSFTGVVFSSEPAEDAALMIRVEGQVRVQSGDAEALLAEPMQRVAAGDQLSLPENSSVKLVFYKTGVQETWTGPGTIAVASAKGNSATLQAEKRELPALMAAQLLRMPDSAQHSKTGMVRLRSLKDIEKILEIESHYADYREALQVDDTTPELYFISGMLELKQYDRVREFLIELDQTHPEAPAYQELVTHFLPLVTPATPSETKPKPEANPKQGLEN